MAEVTDAAGVALIVDGVCELAGETPAMADVLRLADWMNQMPDMELYQSRELGLAVGWADTIQGVASGILAIRISNVKQSYVMWFRPELVRAVNWAGEPTKTLQEERGLEPRTSFKAWKVLVRGQSEPWSEMEIESAREFRAAVMTINLKRAEEAAELSESRCKQLTHALPNMVWTANDDGLLNYPPCPIRDNVVTRVCRSIPIPLLRVHRQESMRPPSTPPHCPGTLNGSSIGIIGGRTRPLEAQLATWWALQFQAKRRVRVSCRGRADEWIAEEKSLRLCIASGLAEAVLKP